MVAFHFFMYCETIETIVCDRKNNGASFIQNFNETVLQ